MRSQIYFDVKFKAPASHSCLSMLCTAVAELLINEVFYLKTSLSKQYIILILILYDLLRTG